LTSLHVANGTTALNGGVVKTSSTQSYDGATSLGAATVLTASSVSFSALNGTHALTVSGAATFGDSVSIGSLVVTQTTALNGGPVTTTAAQTYSGAVTLGNDSALTGTQIGFGGTVDGAHALTVSGNASFGGAVGGTTLLTRLEITNAATLSGGAVKTTGTQSYDGATSLGSDTVLTAASVTFGALNGGHALSVSGNATFGGTVSIASLAVTGTAAINSGSVTTTAAQSYDGATSLGADTVLTGTQIAFGGTLDGAHALVVSGDARFGGIVGGQTALTSLAVAGGSAFNGAAITTTGGQSYNGPGTLGVANVAFNTSGGTIAFHALTGAGDNLTVNLGVNGAVKFNGQVGAPGAALGALNVSGTGGSFTIAPAIEVYVTTADIELPGGIVDMGATLNASGPVTISANTISGEIQDQSTLTVVNASFFNVIGTVGGNTTATPDFLIFEGTQPFGSFNGQQVGQSAITVSGTFADQSTLQITGPLSQALSNPGASLAGEINPVDINPAAGPAACSGDSSDGSQSCQASPDATYNYANAFLAGKQP
jgi:hypothetical protein